MHCFNASVAALLLVASTGASATALVDGGFEARGAATPVSRYCYDGFAIVDPACAASPWTGGGVIKSGNGDWGNTIAAEGNFYGFVQSSQTLSQSFTATQSGIGRLTWLDANRTNNGGLQNYDVTLSDGTATTLLGSYTSGFGGFVARTVSGFGVITGTNYTVSFIGKSTDDRTAFIDGVSVSAVPEPATWAMLMIGFGLVGAVSRRRRMVVAA